jgi:hypothetical protein
MQVRSASSRPVIVAGIECAQRAEMQLARKEVAGVARLAAIGDARHAEPQAPRRHLVEAGGELVALLRPVRGHAVAAQLGSRRAVEAAVLPLVGGELLFVLRRRSRRLRGAAGER